MSLYRKDKGCCLTDPSPSSEGITSYILHFIMEFNFNDGGRADAGYKGRTGDCVTRAVAIAAELPYKQVYERLAEGNATQRITKRFTPEWKSFTRKWFFALGSKSFSLSSEPLSKPLR